MHSLKIVVALVLILAGTALKVDATHLRAGEITVDRVSCNGLTFIIRITAYTNTGSPVHFEDGTLNFGDGTTVQTPRIDNTDLGGGIGKVVFETTHTFPGAGRYVITYKERNRNAGILNMSNSVNTQFFLETVIIIDPFIGCDNSPKLLVPPIDKGCTGGAWYHNPGAYDPDGDSLSYQFVIPKQDKGIVVGNYRDPNVKEFYDKVGIDYSKANEQQNGSPTFNIDPVTGTILWDAPGAPGEYNIAFKVIEWRKIGTVWKQIGYVTRDMQIIIEDCLNKRPELTVPLDVCVIAGTSISETILGNDPDADDQLKVEAFSEVFQLNPSPATFTPNPAAFTTARPAKLDFKWDTKCEHIKDQPYFVVFKVSDKSTRGPSLVQFKTWRITVIGAKPVWNTAIVDVPTRSATLNWQPYSCKISASSMEVWRRVDSFLGNPGPCVTGMPPLFGYTRIGTVPIGTTTFVDNKLSSGAKYCYRLVAIFPQPRGGQSIVSDEICIPPFKADRPVITNVSIDKTGSTDGLISIKWVAPLDIDVTNFPPPYTYEVYRAEGFTGKINLKKVSPGKISTTQYQDAGMNSRDIIFNYRILGYDANGNKIDTSAFASSVRLSITPKTQQLELRWAANVPWSNKSFKFPTHTIYRGPGGATEAQLVKIADVNVNQKGFVYTDTGLDEKQTYCYRVETIGSYGNPAIAEPLSNFSQIACGQPVIDKDPPCKPVLVNPNPTGQDCDKYFATTGCGSGGVFSNTISWLRPSDTACKLDVKSYAVYYATRVGDEFKKLPLVVLDTFFVHNNLPSYAGCYKVSAVDAAGNESQLSEQVCFDNCPYYELPNVFTPNGDDCNDKFSAYSTRFIGENGASDCQKKSLSTDQLILLQMKCARFVQKVTVTIFNRWGGEVYSYQSGGERSIYVDWDGRDNGGKDLSTGVYYYEAQVVFDVVDPAKQNRTIKGWVQLIR